MAYLNLRDSFVFYGAYHHNTINKLIHIVCVPVIFTTSICYFSFLPGNIDLLAVCAYGLSFLAMEFTAALLYFPLLIIMYIIGHFILSSNLQLCTILFVGSWILQFVGHGIYEKRKPALIDNLPQSFHAAVFFVWLEVLFYLGYKPVLRRELESLIITEIAKLKK